MRITEESLRRHGFTDFDHFPPYNKENEWKYLRMDIGIGWIYVSLSKLNDTKRINLRSLYYKNKPRTVNDTKEYLEFLEEVKRELKSGTDAAILVESAIEELKSYDVAKEG
jgi:hypothetical protein